MSEKSEMRLKEVFTTSNPDEISFIKSLFEVNKIKYVIEGEGFSHIYPLSIPVQIKVDETQLEMAKDLLKDLNRTRLEAIEKEKKESKDFSGITIFAWIEIIVIGSAMSLTGWLLLMGPSENILKLHHYASNRELHHHIALFMLLYTPCLVGAIGVLSRKDWARRLLIIMNFLLIGIYIYNLSIGHHKFRVTALVSYLWYFWLIYYFSRPKIAKQFK